MDFESHPRLQALARPCLRGYSIGVEKRSFCGGLPWVDDGFEWPRKNGIPLLFVAQIACADVPDWKRSEGALLFFYSNEQWGLSPKDQGHVRVLWQAGRHPCQPPVHERSRFFGLSRKKTTPRQYRKVYLEFRSSLSYPDSERLGFEFPDEASHEAYAEFLAGLSSPVQIGGFPQPIQSDCMELDCEASTGISRERWQLMVQMNEVGDQTWGDAGALYWFVPDQDLESGRYDRIWMVTQCH